MIRFNGSVSEFRKFLSSNFTKKAISGLRVQVDVDLSPLPAVPKTPEHIFKLSDELFRRCQGAVTNTECTNKIQAIKAVREVSSMGLKEAKEWVEYFYPTRFASFSQ